MTDLPSSPDVPPKPPAPPSQPPRDLLTPGMIDALAKTRPWVRFLSILGFVLVGLMFLLAVGMGAFGVFQTVKSGAAGFALVGMALLYVGMAILYIFPSRYLSRYAKSISQALGARSKSQDVEQALRHQKSFWKFTGILTLVMLLLYIPGILAAIAIPNFLTATQRARQKRTMADMRTIAAAVEAYATDVNAYPAGMSMDELAKLLEPTYVKQLPRLDGWSHPFVYEGAQCNGGQCQSYFIASAAKDGKLEREPPSAYASEGKTATKTSDEDIVFSDGSFLRYPEGVTTTE